MALIYHQKWADDHDDDDDLELGASIAYRASSTFCIPLSVPSAYLTISQKWMHSNTRTHSQEGAGAKSKEERVREREMKSGTRRNHADRVQLKGAVHHFECNKRKRNGKWKIYRWRRQRRRRRFSVFFLFQRFPARHRENEKSRRLSQDKAECGRARERGR